MNVCQRCRGQGKISVCEFGQPMRLEQCPSCTGQKALTLPDAIQALIDEVPGIAAGDKVSIHSIMRAQVQHRRTLEELKTLRSRPSVEAQLAKIPAPAILKMLENSAYWAPEIAAHNFRQWALAMVEP